MNTTQKRKTAVILGLPNTGKSHVFNNMTGEYSLVGNSPFTTIETKKGQCRVDGEVFDVFDTPGLHCLYIHSEEELAVRNMLLSEPPDVLIQCIDANRLKQSLSLTADLLELGIPLVISLNAIDETTKRGLWIDSAELSNLLGIPVIESVPVNGRGTRELISAMNRVNRPQSPIRYGPRIEEGIALLKSMMPEEAAFNRKLATLIVMNDPYLASFLRETFGEETATRLDDAGQDVRSRFQGHPGRAIDQKKNLWIDQISEKVVQKLELELGGLSQTIARLCRHPLYGVPILVSLLVVMYLLVVNVANVIADWMDGTLWAPVDQYCQTMISSEFLKDFLIGDYGLLSLGLANALLTVFPILTVFFLAFNTIEDIGYVPNLCVLTKKLFEKIGLSGGAIMPLVLGFGCKTMATLTTKSLKSKRERYIAIYLIAFAIPCAAQMGLNMGILGRIGFSAFLIAFGVLAFVEIASGVILNLILKKEEKGDFIQALPPIRLPSLRAVLKKTYYRMRWFLKEAVPIFLYAAVALFVIDKIGLLDGIKSLVSPLMIGFLGLPLEMVDALILCMARHEAAAGLIMDLVDQGQLDYKQCIIAVTITTMFVPCFTNVMAMIKQLGTNKALTMAVIINASAFLIAGALHYTLVLLL